MDRTTGLRFLVDSGANVSVIPRSVKQNNSSASECKDYKLYAANGTEIKTYGIKTMVLDLKLRRAFRWTFIVADVKQPIIGADFLAHYKLLVDLSTRRLIDQVTNLNVLASISQSLEHTIKTVDDKHPYYELLAKYPELTKPISFRETPKHNVHHHIETTGPPVFARARQLPPDRYTKAREEFRVMQELGICRPSKSEWASPLHIVPKKDGNIRPCGDYRKLNSITKPDRYPVPRLHDFTYVLTGKKIYSRLDINRAYNCIAVAESDIEKTAVITPFGLFEFPRMPFGLRNAAQTFQRFMHHTVLTGLDFLFSYVDDVIIASDDVTQHKQHLEEVFKRFDEHGITINLAKCCFGQEKLDFLGYEVSTEGIRPLDHKVKAIIDFPKPKTVAELHRFLGMLNFYRSHIPNAAEIQSELYKYIRKTKKNDKTPIVWTTEAETQFEKCKLGLQQAATLSHPSSDTPLALMTDASDACLGAALHQMTSDGQWKPLGYYSKKLTAAQCKYSTYDRELLAIYMAIVHFRNMVEGRKLIIFTDHKPITYAFSKLSSDKETPRRARQLIYISEFTTDIRHVSGDKNVVADTLSRVETITCPTTFDYAELAHAQNDDEQLTLLLNDSNNHLLLKSITLPDATQSIYCEMSTSRARPYLPKQFRYSAFQALHNISHPGIRTTRKLMKDRYFWKTMNRDIGTWAKSCIKCQRSKVQKHTVSDLQQFEQSDRFQHIHIDIVGPLPITSEGFRYLVTVIDRFTHWPEAFPVKDITASTVAKALYEGWITRFGCPEKLTSDQGRQFESSLFSQLMTIMGIRKIRTTPYHPQSNGAVERWHRTLKAALMTKLESTSWVDELPTVLFGLRAAVRADTGFSSAELTYGRTIRLPGDFYDVNKIHYENIEEYVSKLRDIIIKYKPTKRENVDSRNFFVHKDLESCEYVFIRNDTVRRPLQHPYDGPYRVIARNNKVFKIQLSNRETNISIDRLKPAYILVDKDTANCTPVRLNNPNTDTVRDCQAKPTKSLVSPGNNAPTQQMTTRSGRVVKMPVRFQ